MALFLVIGPPASGKSTLIRALAGSVTEWIPDNAADCDTLIARANGADVWVSTTSEDLAAHLRPVATWEYTVRHHARERMEALEAQLRDLEARLQEARSKVFSDTPPAADGWEVATVKPPTDPRVTSEQGVMLATLRARRLAGNLLGYTQAQAAALHDGTRTQESTVYALYQRGYLERRKRGPDGPYHYRARRS